MPLLKDRDREKVASDFAAIEHPVKLVVFVQQDDCDYCVETEALAREVAALSPKLSVEVYDVAAHRAEAERYRVDKAPAIVVEGERDYGVRFYGIPMGYEFVSLLGAITDAGRRATELAAETRAALGRLTSPVHLQVYVTPTCPYCPAAVRLAHQFAMESDLVTADMVEASEFPALAQRYRIQAVPKTIVNETGEIEGGLPEALFVEQVVDAVTSSPSS